MGMERAFVVVNGQLKVSAGGQVEVPTLRADSALLG
jgi:hypothetical protein